MRRVQFIGFTGLYFKVITAEMKNILTWYVWEKKNHSERHAFYSNLTCVTVIQCYHLSHLKLDLSTRKLERTMNYRGSLLV